ncbi:MAG: 50S ribosomal protein L6 [Candidatus Altiarchaeota archaeon]|nr:50S ribosomal protein L6 [Candidatus Altiarchaeota archaeon]
MENSKKHVEVAIGVPEGVSVDVKERSITVSGKSGSISRTFTENFVHLVQKDGKVLIQSKSARQPYKKQLAIVGTIRAHIRNMLKSAAEGVVYRMRIVYSHFPMRVSVSGDKVLISNFLGEKFPRSSKVLEGVKIDVKGNEVTLSGVSKENVSQTAANIEQITRIKNRDPRVFQDGVYIIEKDGKSLLR